jgi:hypothetical protein
MCDQRYELNTDPENDILARERVRKTSKICHRSRQGKDNTTIGEIMIQRRLKNERKQRTIGGSKDGLKYNCRQMLWHRKRKRCKKKVSIGNKLQSVHEVDHTCPKGGPELNQAAEVSSRGWHSLGNRRYNPYCKQQQRVHQRCLPQQLPVGCCQY